ncbi:MAG: tRNA dimethylallyltransferase, partial [Fimbriimonadaceae bacterium]
LLEGYGEMHAPPPPGLRDQLNSMSLPDLVAKLRDLAPEAGTQIDLNNPVRVTRAIERLHSTKSELASIDLSAYQIVKIGLDASQAWLSLRIEQRTKEMLGLGWLQEVAQIRDLGFKSTDPGLKAHGYRTLWHVLEGTKDIEQAEQEITIMVRQYAKRQRTWLRAEPNLCKIWAEDGQRSVEDAFQCISKVGAHG